MSSSRNPCQETTVRRATRGVRTLSLTGKTIKSLGYIESLDVSSNPSAFMTFCLARESANRVKGHTQRPFPTKERPPEMLILTPEHGIREECRNLDCLDLDGALEGLGLLCGLGLGLGTHDATTPVALGLLVLLGVTLLDGLDELGKLSLVLGANLGDGADGGGLKVLLVQIC
jgi:hypothetical protein